MECDIATSLFNISSSTLTSVGINLDMSNLPGLEQLLFPNLEVVDGVLWVACTSNLTRIDITKLKRVGGVSLAVPALRQLDLDDFQGFTAPDSGNIWIGAAGSAESIDKFFKDPLPNSVGESHSITVADNSTDPWELTVGWSNATDMLFHAAYLNVTLGTSETTSMNMETLNAAYGVNFHRHSDLQNLTVGEVTLYGGYFDGLGPETLTLPFDNISTVNLVADLQPNLTTIVLPAKADHWGNVSLFFDTKNVVFREHDDDGAKLWNWPPRMYDVTLGGSLKNDFL